jgi:Lectin C-type domain
MQYSNEKNNNVSIGDKMRIYSKILGLIIIGIGFASCDFNSHTEPELNIYQAEIYGESIYINKSNEKPIGITDTLFINERDTFKLDLKTRLLNDPEYIWDIEDDNVLKIIPIPDDPLTFYAVALSDSGATTTLLLEDDPNEASKKLNVVITKQWADPDYYKSIGKFGGHHYYINQKTTKWLEAKDLCENAGGYLACINSVEENLFLNEQRIIEGDDGAVWIGLQYVPNSTGGFEVKYWVNGDELIYVPHDLPGANYGRTLFFGLIHSNYGRWNNFKVSDGFRYILEIE